MLRCRIPSCSALVFAFLSHVNVSNYQTRFHTTQYNPNKSKFIEFFKEKNYQNYHQNYCRDQAWVWLPVRTKNYFSRLCSKEIIKIDTFSTDLKKFQVRWRTVIGIYQPRIGGFGSPANPRERNCSQIEKQQNSSESSNLSKCNKKVKFVSGQNWIYRQLGEHSAHFWNSDAHVYLCAAIHILKHKAIKIKLIHKISSRSWPKLMLPLSPSPSGFSKPRHLCEASPVWEAVVTFVLTVGGKTSAPA